MTPGAWLAVQLVAVTISLASLGAWWRYARITWLWVAVVGVVVQTPAGMLAVIGAS